MNWLKNFARGLWQQTPRNIGIGQRAVEKIEKLQVLGIQADELRTADAVILLDIYPKSFKVSAKTLP